MEDTLKHAEVDGIPVTIDTRDFARRSMLKLMARMRNAEDPFDQSLATLEFAERILGDEQLENVCNALDPDGDPDFRVLAAFVDKAIVAASSEEDAKN